MGSARRPRRHPVQGAQSLARSGRLGTPRAVRQGALRALAREALEATEGLTLLEGMARVAPRGRRRGSGRRARRAGEAISARAVVVTTGTFLRGLMHTGRAQTEGGRVGEAAARRACPDPSSALGLKLGRFKTGTPPRVHRDTVDYADCAPQRGDEPPVPFSFRTGALRARPGPLLADGDESRRARSHPREPAREPDVLGSDPRARPALLSLRRGQGRQVRGQAEPHALPRARGPRRGGDLRQRPLDEPAGGDPARSAARDPGAARRADAAAGLRRRVRLQSSRPAPGDARDAGRRAALPRRADQRHVRLRGSGGPGALGRNQRGPGGLRRRSASCSSAARRTPP